MFCEIIRPVIYSLFPIGIEVAYFCSILGPMVSRVPGFGLFRLHERADDANAGFSVGLEGIAVVWLRVVHGNEGVSDRDHLFSVEERPSCFRFCC